MTNQFKKKKKESAIIFFGTTDQQRGDDVNSTTEQSLKESVPKLFAYTSPKDGNFNLVSHNVLCLKWQTKLNTSKNNNII